ncbi:MAG: amino acid adenylation domain-containing protein [Actinomycetota bacterium]|nr:amino acid adenylation domain-containing protein [Actinomycetota bacterium]
MNEICSTRSFSGADDVPATGTEEHRFQASFGQERLWVLEHLRADVPLYMHSVAMRCRGPLDVDALRVAANELVRRHETLRTRFEISGGRLLQVIARRGRVDVPVIDLTGLGLREVREAEARRLADAVDDEPVDLGAGDLVRFRLFRIAPDEHVLVVAIHHIVSDGWSIGLIWSELGAAYDAFAAGRTPDLPELPLQYADYAVWQREWLAGPELTRQVAYWRETLDGAPPVLKLPTDRPRPPVQSFDGAALPVSIGGRAVAALEDLGRAAGATLFMTVAAALAAVLHRYSTQDEVLLATPVAGRRRSEIESLIGFFVNTLILRTRCDGNPTFRELVTRARDAALGAYAHQDLPFEKLVEELNPERDLSHLPLAQAMLALQTAPATELSLTGLDVEPFPLAEDMAPYDLTVELQRVPDGLTGSILYNTDLFDPSTIRQMIRHLERFAGAVAARPDVRVDDVALLDAAEREQVLRGWLDDRPALARPPLLHRLLEERAAADPARVALDSDGTDVTYGELDRLTKELAARIRAAGLPPESRVALLLDKSAEMVVALTGVLRSGAAFVPLDPAGPPDRLRLILDDLEPALVLTRRAELDRSREVVDSLQAPTEVWLLDEPATLPPPAEEDEAPIGIRDLAYVIYTSGSTGVPKGVMIEQRGILGMVESIVERYEIHSDVRFLQFMSIGFDASFTEIFPTLLVGGTLVLRSRAEMLPGPDLLDLLRRDRITHLLTTPSALSVMRPGPLSDLETLVVCGEACSAELVARWARGRRFVNAYGPTEVTVCTHTAHVTEEGRPPIGFGLANTESYVLDTRLEPVPLGVAGELHIASPGLARGYLHRPDLTAAAFVPNPHGAPGSLMYKTGDVVRCRRDGQIDFLGRVDDQAKIRGFRIEPGEIESALVRHPGVHEAVVLSDGAGTTAARLVAYVTPTGARPDVHELRAFLARKLPAYMIPAAFVWMHSLPHSSSGKIDRAALPDPSSAADAGSPYVPPATATEKEVAGVWGEVLGLHQVGVRDKFFESGGNSLKIVELFERLEAIYPATLSVAELFEHPTVAAMAAAIDARTGAEDGRPALSGFEL